MADRKVTVSLFGDDRDLDQKIADAKRKLDELKAKGAKIPVGLDKQKFDQDIRSAQIKLDELNRKKASPKIDTTKASLELDKLDLGIDRTELKLDKLAMKGVPEAGQSFTALGGNLGALSNFAMPALIAGLVGVSGQLITVGFGLAGFGAAAFRTLDPLLKAAQKTGGLAANLKDLNPAQKEAAAGLLTLSGDYAKFSNSLAPEVMSTFNKGLVLTDHLMGDIQPVAKETGKAFSGLLGQIDAEFQGGTWQNFFGFMKKEAGPDVKQLGTLFTDLLGSIPPLTEALHPLGSVIISDLDSITKFTAGLGQLSLQVEHFSSGAVATAQKVKSGNGTTWWDSIKQTFGAGVKTLPLVGAVPMVKGWIDAIENTGKASQNAAAGQGHLATAARAAALAAQAEQNNMNSLATAIGNVIDKTLTLQGDDVSWHQALLAANSALKQVKGNLDGNSKSALNAKQALITMTQAAEKSAQDQLTLHHNMAGANDILNRQIAYLADHAGKSKFAQAQIMALIRAEQAIPHNIQSAVHLKSAAAAAALANIMNRMAALNGMTSTVYVDYSVGGQSYVVPHHRHTAKGWLVSGGVPNKDSVPILAMPGEAVVPKRLVPAVAPFLKSQGVPGFASGGYIAPSPPMPAGRGGNTYNIHIAPTPLAHPRDIGREVVNAIRAFEQGSGTSWRS